MNMFRADKTRRWAKSINMMVDHLGTTITDVETWIKECGGVVPTIYHEAYYEQLDVDRWSDKTDIFDKDGNHVSDDKFREGDILDLAEMPFEKDGRRPTGYAIWHKAAGGNCYWVYEYNR